MFLRDAEGLELGDQLELQVSLPGFGDFDLSARVAHIIGDREAAGHHRGCGAGLQLVASPDGYGEAIDGYLQRLEHRGESMVLVADDRFALLVAATGYQTMPLPALSELVSAVEHSPAPVVGLIVPKGSCEEVSRAVSGLGRNVVVIPMNDVGELDLVLQGLDLALLPSPPRPLATP